MRALLGRVGQWRVGWQWYAVATGLPIVIALVVQNLHSVLGGSPNIGPGDPPLLLAILALLVIGEEVGWRGFALPRLQMRFGDLGASLILGVLWAAWHLANTRIPGLEYYGSGFLAFLLYVIAMTVLFTWIANHTRGSVLLAWLFHAAINVTGSAFFLGDSVRQWWLSAVIYGIVALVVLGMSKLKAGRRERVVAQGEHGTPAKEVGM